MDMAIAVTGAVAPLLVGLAAFWMNVSKRLTRIEEHLRFQERICKEHCTDSEKLDTRIRKLELRDAMHHREVSEVR